MLIGMYSSCALSCVYTYGVGFGVVVRIKGQYQSLEERNSNSAGPAFLCLCIKQDLRSCESRIKTFSTMSEKAEKLREAQRKLEEKMRQTPPPPPYTGRDERQRTR